jgi:phasin family protein
MATKASKSPTARKSAPKKRAAKPAAKAPAGAIPIKHGTLQIPDPAQFAKYAKVVTPEQAFELYKANAKMALEIINAAIENTAKVRKLQFEGEEQARSMQKKVARTAAEAPDAQTLMAASQTAAQEAIAQSMEYWGQMFELIADMQKRLFVMMESQMQGVPGVKEAKAAMAMLPDLTPAKDLVAAMRNVMSSGGTTFESMQRVMADFAKFAQQSMPGIKR